MKFQIAIVDDESTSREYVASLVSEWGMLHSHSIHITPFPSAEAFLFDYTGNNIFDILLLDIEMGEMNGVELAKAVRQEEKNGKRTEIVFITGYPDFISEGYDVAALHYLMKPVNGEKLFRVLDRAAENSKVTAKKLIFHTDGEDRAVYADSIFYAEMFSHTVRIVTEDGDFETRMKLSELEIILGEDFIKAHRSYIVGLRHISSLTKTELTLDSGKTIPISRSEQQKVHTAFVRYFKGDSV